jgi:polar amino acid transport system substrate-binding protein
MPQGTRKLMIWTRALVLASLTWMGISQPIYAQEKNQKLIPLTISAGEWPPYLSAELPEQGLAAKLIRDIFLEAGYQVRFQFLPWARAYQDTKQGRYAATAVWMKVPNREVDFWYSDAVLEEQFVFFHLKSTAFDFQSLEDLADVNLGGGLGYSYGAAFDAALAAGTVKLSRVGDTEQNFRRLLKGRIQAFPEEMRVGYQVLHHQLAEFSSQITHNPNPLLINQSFVLFPKNTAQSDVLQKIFNRGLAEFRKSGRYQQYFPAETMSEKHVKPKTSQNQAN